MMNKVNLKKIESDAKGLKEGWENFLAKTLNEEQRHELKGAHTLRKQFVSSEVEERLQRGALVLKEFLQKEFEEKH